MYIYSVVVITKTYLYNFDPFKPHFYIVKLGFTGVYIIFLISAQNIDCGYSLEPPRRGGSNEYLQSTFLIRNMTNIRIFYLKIFHFLVIKFSVYLNRHVFVMLDTCTPIRVISKQCRHRLDAEERGVSSGSPLFANSLPIFSLGISKSHNWMYLQLKLDSFNI